MALFSRYRQTRLALTAEDSLQALHRMQRFFESGAKWNKYDYHARDGTKCLVGAAQHVRQMSDSALDDVSYLLRQAIAEKTGRHVGAFGIEGFNDSRTSYREIEEVLQRARELALQHARQTEQPALTYQPQQDRVIEVTIADLERVAKRRA